MGNRKTRKMVLLSLMVAYSLVLYVIEMVIPNPLMAIFPGAKLGLGNIVTLLCLINFGFKDTFIVLTVRIIMSTMFGGPASSILYSMGGGYLSLVTMYISLKFVKFSNIGISISGAIAHNVGQLLVAAAIINTINILGYLPFMLGASVLTGLFTGLVVNLTNPYLEKILPGY